MHPPTSLNITCICIILNLFEKKNNQWRRDRQCYFKKVLLRCLGSQTRDTNVFRLSLISSSRRYVKKHKQYNESNLMQYALSYRDAFQPCTRISSGDYNTIYTALKQNIQICDELKFRLKILTAYACVQSMYFFFLNFILLIWIALIKLKIYFT